MRGGGVGGARRSLERLLASLLAADHEGLWVDLAFWIDRPGPGSSPGPGPGPDPETIRVAEETVWPFGIKSVNVWPRCVVNEWSMSGRGRLTSQCEVTM